VSRFVVARFGPGGDGGGELFAFCGRALPERGYVGGIRPETGRGRIAPASGIADHEASAANTRNDFAIEDGAVGRGIFSGQIWGGYPNGVWRCVQFAGGGGVCDA